MTRFIEQTLWGRALFCNLKTWRLGLDKVNTIDSCCSWKHNQDTNYLCKHVPDKGATTVRVGKWRKDLFATKWLSTASTLGQIRAQNRSDPFVQSKRCGMTLWHYLQVILAVHCCGELLLGLKLRKTKKKTLSYSMTSLPLTSPDWLGDGQAAQLASKTRFLCSVRVSQRYTKTAFDFEYNIAFSQTTYTTI